MSSQDLCNDLTDSDKQSMLDISVTIPMKPDEDFLRIFTTDPMRNNNGMRRSSFSDDKNTSIQWTDSDPFYLLNNSTRGNIFAESGFSKHNTNYSPFGDNYVAGNNSDNSTSFDLFDRRLEEFTRPSKSGNERNSAFEERNIFANSYNKMNDDGKVKKNYNIFIGENNNSSNNTNNNINNNIEFVIQGQNQQQSPQKKLGFEKDSKSGSTIDKLRIYTRSVMNSDNKFTDKIMNRDAQNDASLSYENQSVDTTTDSSQMFPSHFTIFKTSSKNNSGVVIPSTTTASRITTNSTKKITVSDYKKNNICPDLFNSMNKNIKSYISKFSSSNSGYVNAIHKLGSNDKNSNLLPSSTKALISSKESIKAPRFSTTDEQKLPNQEKLKERSSNCIKNTHVTNNSVSTLSFSNSRITTDNLVELCLSQNGYLLVKNEVASTVRGSKLIDVICVKLMCCKIFYKIIRSCYGNYVFQELTKKLKDDQAIKFFSMASRNAAELLELSQNKYATHCVQALISRVMEIPNTVERNGALKTFINCIMQRIGCYMKGKIPYNVILRTFTCIGEPYINQIIHYIINNLVFLGLDQIGCIIVKKLLEVNSSQKDKLMNLVVSNIYRFSEDEYGNYIVQKCIEECQKNITKYQTTLETIVGMIIPKLSQYCLNKYASNIIELILKTLKGALKSNFIKCIVECDNIRQIIDDQYGNYVIQVLVSTCSRKVRNYLDTHIGLPKKGCYGKSASEIM